MLSAPCRHNDTVDEVQVVIGREVQLLSSDVRRSPHLLDELLDPDFREVGASGRLWSRAEMIRELPSDAADEDDAITVTDMHGVRLSGEIVLVTYISERCGRRARRSSLWRRSDRTWRVLYHQGTIVDGA